MDLKEYISTVNITLDPQLRGRKALWPHYLCTAADRASNGGDR